MEVISTDAGGRRRFGRWAISSAPPPVDSFVGEIPRAFRGAWRFHLCSNSGALDNSAKGGRLLSWSTRELAMPFLDLSPCDLRVVLRKKTTTVSFVFVIPWSIAQTEKVWAFVGSSIQ
uniref:Uncharacterized protein n=1 Tax=Oryza punctata TaxID=4537 RepID=A0A0E0JFW4_ORYPU